MTQIEQIKDYIAKEIQKFPHKEGLQETNVVNALVRNVLKELENFIDSLPVEQVKVSEDLEEEIKNYFNSEIGMNFLPSCDNINIARHFANWQKKQLMKNCLCDTEVMMHTKLRNTEYLILSNVILPPLPVSFGLNVGDKVKILIIKQ